MAEVSAKDVAALRKATGAGMMDCKQALEQNDGDAEKALDWLRAKGIAKAGKLGEREATEGAVEAVVDGNVGVIVETPRPTAPTPRQLTPEEQARKEAEQAQARAAAAQAQREREARLAAGTAARTGAADAPAQERVGDG